MLELIANFFRVNLSDKRRPEPWQGVQVPFHFRG